MPDINPDQEEDMMLYPIRTMPETTTPDTMPDVIPDMISDGMLEDADEAAIPLRSIEDPVDVFANGWPSSRWLKDSGEHHAQYNEERHQHQVRRPDIIPGILVRDGMLKGSGESSKPPDHQHQDAAATDEVAARTRRSSSPWEYTEHPAVKWSRLRKEAALNGTLQPAPGLTPEALERIKREAKSGESSTLPPDSMPNGTPNVPGNRSPSPWEYTEHPAVKRSRLRKEAVRMGKLPEHTAPGLTPEALETIKHPEQPVVTKRGRGHSSSPASSEASIITPSSSGRLTPPPMLGEDDGLVADDYDVQTDYHGEESTEPAPAGPAAVGSEPSDTSVVQRGTLGMHGVYAPVATRASLGGHAVHTPLVRRGSIGRYNVYALDRRRRHH